MKSCRGERDPEGRDVPEQKRNRPAEVAAPCCSATAAQAPARLDGVAEATHKSRAACASAETVK